MHRQLPRPFETHGTAFTHCHIVLHPPIFIAVCQYIRFQYRDTHNINLAKRKACMNHRFFKSLQLTPKILSLDGSIGSGTFALKEIAPLFSLEDPKCAAINRPLFQLDSVFGIAKVRAHIFDLPQKRGFIPTIRFKILLCQSLLLFLFGREPYRMMHCPVENCQFMK